MSTLAEDFISEQSGSKKVDEVANNVKKIPKNISIEDIMASPDISFVGLDKILQVYKSNKSRDSIFQDNNQNLKHF